MRTIFLVLCVLLAAGAGRVAAQEVGMDFDKNADFSKYKTYKWVSIPSSQKLDEMTADQLTGTLEVELANKGLKKSTSDDADLYIGYQVDDVTQGKALRNFRIGASYGSQPGGNMATAAASTTVHSGRLILDVYDASNKHMVWQGWVLNSIEEDAKPDKRQKHLTVSVEKLLRNYPPRKKS
jgi:Domain of unknown function (DUF4136)